LLLTFDINDERDYFLTILPIHESFVPKLGEAQDGVQDELQLSTFAQKFLNVMSDSPLSRQEIMQLINQQNTTKSVRNAFGKLLELQLIAYTLPGKPSSKNQRYVLTQLGREYRQRLGVTKTR